MDAGSALGSMQAHADCCIRVIGDFGAAVQVNERVVLACRDHLQSTRRKQRPQPNAEGKICSFFELAAREVSTRVIASMGGVDHHNKPRGCCGTRLARLRLLGKGSQRHR